MLGDDESDNPDERCEKADYTPDPKHYPKKQNPPQNPLPCAQ